MRRYSDFLTTDKLLRDLFELNFPVKLSPKNFVKSTLFDRNFLNDRFVSLQRYLDTINNCGNSIWRDSKIWFNFLGLENSSNHQSQPSLFEYNSTGYSQWLEATKILQGNIEAIKKKLKDHESLLPLFQENKISHKKLYHLLDDELISIKDDYLQLQNQLEGIECAPQEKLRRNKLLESVSQDLESVLRICRNIRPNLDQNHRTRWIGSNSGLSDKGKSVEIQNNPEILRKQRLALQKQEGDLENLTTLIQRQKKIAQEISTELSLQNSILTEVNDSADDVKSKLDKAQGQVARF